MDEMIGHLPTLPPVVWSLILTPLFVVIGALAGWGVQKSTGWRWAVPGALILAFAIGNGSANLMVRVQAGTREAKALAQEIEATEPLKTILRLEPAVRDAFERDLIGAMKSGTDQEKSAAARKVYLAIVVPRQTRALPLAGAAELRRGLVAELAVLHALESRPSLCVDVFAGRGLPNVDMIDATLGNEMLAAKGAVIESATLRPEKLEAPLTSDAIVGIVQKAAERRGDDGTFLRDFGRIGALEPDKACGVAIRFETLLLDLDPKDTAAILKSQPTSASAAPR